MPHAADANPSQSHSPSKARIHPQITQNLRNLWMDFAACYGRASTLKKNLNEPVCFTPSTKFRLTLAPGATGFGSVIVPMLVLSAPPKACVGGCSTFVPNTVTAQGGVAGVPVAAQVDASLMSVTWMSVEVIALKSAIPSDIERLLKSTIRNRNCVTFAPVLLTKRRLTASVP